jgi:hypothetical protein
LTSDTATNGEQTILNGSERNINRQILPAFPGECIAHNDAFASAAIDQASRIIPVDYWSRVGVYTFLQQRGNEVFKKLTLGQK